MKRQYRVPDEHKLVGKDLERAMELMTTHADDLAKTVGTSEYHLYADGVFCESGLGLTNHKFNGDWLYTEFVSFSDYERDIDTNGEESDESQT